MPPRIAVVGAGAWGTTLARLIAGAEPVILLCHTDVVADEIARTRRNEGRLPGIDLPDGVLPSADPASLAEATDVVIFATPSRHLRATVELGAPNLVAGADLLSVVKGLETGSLLRMSELIASAAAVSPERVAALSGPNLAL